MTPPTTDVIEIERGGDENITINYNCGGSDCGGGSNSGGDNGGGDGGNGGGRESNGDVGCGRANDDGDDEDNDGDYGGGKSDNVTTVTGTVAMGWRCGRGWGVVKRALATTARATATAYRESATRDDAKTSLLD